jgi:hypothetical protein
MYITGKEKIMDQLKELKEIAKEAERKLDEDGKWKWRYANYAEKILGNKIIIESLKCEKGINQPLYLYSNITKLTNIKKGIMFDLRYKGLSVARIKYDKDEKFIEPKKNIFKYYKKLESMYHEHKIDFEPSFQWGSSGARIFLSFFSSNPGNPNTKKGIKTESRIESSLITKLHEKASKNIEPVLLVKNRFQMPSPLMNLTENQEPQKEKKYKQGHIDILCKTTHDSEEVLDIIELKKDNILPQIAVFSQAIIYSVFIHKLLRTPEAGSNTWLKLFGFSKVPQINAVAALPHREDGKNDEYFKHKKIEIDGDTIGLYYFWLSLSEETQEVEDFETSLFGKK